MIHIMLDLETLGTRPGSVILTIGAVAFSVENGVTDSYYESIDREDSEKYGLRVCPNTQAWWMDQSQQSIDAAFSGLADLESTLEGFRGWVANLPISEWRDVRLWGNGSDFDNSLLAEVYAVLSEDYGVPALLQPWSFTGNRCYRTVKNLFPGVTVPSVGTMHNALDDATYQANHLIAIAKQHNLTLA